MVLDDRTRQQLQDMRMWLSMPSRREREQLEAHLTHEREEGERRARQAWLEAFVTAIQQHTDGLRLRELTPWDRRNIAAIFTNFTTEDTDAGHEQDSREAASA